MPIRFAPAVMSLFGLALAWRTFAEYAGMAQLAGSVMSIGAVLIGLVTLGSILLHQISSGAFRETWGNPQLRVLPAALTVGLMLLSGLLAPHMPALARVLIWVAALSHLFWLAVLFQRWFQGDVPLDVVTPVWFIAWVGLIVVPVGAVPTGEIGLAWFAFSIGLIFWIALLPLVLYRLIFGKAMPPELEATQLILVAPPAIGAVSWSLLVGAEHAVPGLMMLSFAVFLTCMLAPMMLRVFSRACVPANWAFGFPLAALASALSIYGVLLERPILFVASGIVLLVLTVIIAWLLIGSARLLMKH